jgi:hypothetical protein
MDLSSVVQWVQEGGWSVYLNLLLGPVGIIAGTFAVLVSRHRAAALAAGGGALLLGLLAGAIGLVGWLLGRASVDEALVNADPGSVEAMRAVGYEEAAHALVCGGIAGVLPIAAGVLAIVLTTYRGAPSA